MSTPEELFQELQREYLAEAPARLAELRKDLTAIVGGEADAAASLRLRFHRLAGSGGSYGFPQISVESRALEQWLVAHPTPRSAECAHLEEGIAKIAAAFDEAAASAGVGRDASHALFAWQALLLGGRGPTRDRVAEILATSGYRVDVAEVPAPPRRASSRPDIVVLLGTDEAAMQAELVAGWQALGLPPETPSLLVHRQGTADRLLAAEHGITCCVALPELERRLPAWARKIAQIRSAPLRAIVHREGESVGQPLQVALEKSGFHVLGTSTPEALLDAIERDLPDVVVLDAGAGLPVPALVTRVRAIRDGDRVALLPILVIGFDAHPHQRVALFVAGADDVHPPLPVETVAEFARARAERGRTIRLLAHRDDLTGTLTREALMAELDAGVAMARRREEALAVCIIDLDHFRRLNERHGPIVGDAALRHVADLLGRRTRSSDALGRIGGEEFGLVLHRCDRSAAVIAAESLRMAIANEPFAGPGGQQVPLRASIGIAVYPEDGDDGPAVAYAAERAMGVAKRGGRNQVCSIPPS